MSTRSGKRIHGPGQDSPGPVEDTVVVLRSERKTRNKKQNENVDLPTKKRNNYVSYPVHDDTAATSNGATEVQDKIRRKTRRNTLKELNDDIAISISKSTASTSENNFIRKSRRGKKLDAEPETPSQVENIENTDVSELKSVLKEKKKDKKKKNKKKVLVEAATNEQETNNHVAAKKKGGKKKKKSNSLVFIVQEVNHNSNGVLSRSNCSVDSFHSATGSPGDKARFTENIDKKSVPIDDLQTDININSYVNNKAAGSLLVEGDNKLNATFDKTNESEHVKGKNNNIIEKTIDNPNTTFEKKDMETFNCSVEKEFRKSSIKNSTFDKIDDAFQIKANITFEKDDAVPQNSTYDMESPKSQHSSYSRLCNNVEMSLNRTFEKGSKCEISKTKSLDTTFDKGCNANATFDKANEKSSDKLKDDSKKLSLISSDETVNTTDDNLTENSRISITSDESKTENILNATPVLIESSIDESRISENNKTPEVPKSLPSTPLKREGTFTKEDSKATPAKTKLSSEMTSRRKSLPSPGCTPFPLSKKAQVEKSVLNVTRSIEKSVKRSSVAEMGSRQTKVMFCSPVNNPTMVSQMKGRVIKSNLKGSNKSFVFEESVASEPRPNGRKRSHTHNDVETRAKRKRLADDLQHSVDRLSRPRTVSATAKLAEPGTPSKKAATPSKARPERVSRTRLPNFAALHQKQFAKMESLDECQQRKARRARQLLTPTGSVGVIERTSPQGTSPTPAPPTKEATKLHTPSKPKLPTIESLNPGYTRFGFKLNIDVNPFSTTTKKAETKPRVKRPNGLSRQTTCLALPSLEGATATRKDVAKQAVMREKSFTEKRDLKRKENRTVIKGVRTNRRFELQMKMRNINA